MFVGVVVCEKRFENLKWLFLYDPNPKSYHSISKNSCSTTRRSHRKSTCSTCAIRSSLCRLAGLTNRAYAMQKSFCVSVFTFSVHFTAHFCLSTNVKIAVARSCQHVRNGERQMDLDRTRRLILWYAFLTKIQWICRCFYQKKKFLHRNQPNHQRT